MAIYYHPPQPFVGGRQPLAPRDLNPSFEAVPENDPPFSHRDRDENRHVIVAQWVPAPPETWLERWATRHVPISVSAVAEDNPPLKHTFDVAQQAIILQKWEPPPPEPWQGYDLNPELGQAPADNPPFTIYGRTGAYQSLIAGLSQPAPPETWLERWSTRHLPVNITRTPEDDPPFSMRSSAAFVWAWQPAPPEPWTGYTLNAAFQDNPPNDPVFSRTRLDSLVTIIGAWEPPPPMPWMGHDLSPAFASVQVDDPPFAHDGRDVQKHALTVAQWQPVPPETWLERWAVRHVPIEVSAAVVNDPPFAHGGRDVQRHALLVQGWQPPPPETWLERWSTRHLPLTITAIPEDNPPFGMRSSMPFVLAWPSAPPDTWKERWAKPFLVQGEYAPDNPPFTHPGRNPLLSIVGLWQPDQGPLPQQGQNRKPDSVDNPPVASRPSLATILETWQTTAPIPWRPMWFVQITVTVDDPPLLGRSALPGILAAWQVDAILPQQGQKRKPDSVDDPPLTAVAQSTLASIVDSWERIPQQERQKIKNLPVVVSAVVENDPPFNLRLNVPIALSWQIEAPRYPYYTLLVQPAPDNPPFNPQPSMRTILAAWQPGAPDPWMGYKLNPSIEAVPENDPPWSKSRTDQLAGIVEEWQPYSGPQRQQVKNVPIDVSAVPEDTPVFGMRPNLSTILGTWQPEATAPWRQDYVVQGTPRDDPPVRSLVSLFGIVTAWRYEHPVYPRREVIVQGIASAGVTFSDIIAFNLRDDSALACKLCDDSALTCNMRDDTELTCKLDNE